ncbi:hypothetical protein ABT189_23575 [Streptomyces sp900105755]
MRGDRPHVAGHLVEDAGHRVPEENPEGFVSMFLDCDHRARTA